MLNQGGTKPEGLFDRLCNNSVAVSRDDLRRAAQLAVQVEFTTIPPYLTAMYSIKDLSSLAYQTLRGVAMEEMFHLNQAANILVALGGQPRLTGEYAPRYPTYLPHANPKTTPFIGLFRASPAVFMNVFCGIESPAPHSAPPAGDNYDTISQLYASLRTGVEDYPGNPFVADPADGTQRTDIYLGKFGGQVIKVVNKKSFEHALTAIVEQGEGVVREFSPLVPEERYGAYNFYGPRTDGTYGPILGTPLEMSHFAKFRKVALDTANFPPTLPITSNPIASDFTNPDAVKAARCFDKCYSVMLQALEKCFQRREPDLFFGVVLNLMHHVLPQLARTLMNTPAHANGDGTTGPNAAPTWVYQPDARLDDATGCVQELLHEVQSGTVAIPQAAVAPLTKALNGVKMLPTAAELDL